MKYEFVNTPPATRTSAARTYLVTVTMVKVPWWKRVLKKERT